MKNTILFACAVAWMFAAGSASAQTAEAQASGLPDPATVKVPDVSAGTPELDASGDAKYFYFHKDGVSFEHAAGDFVECFGYAIPPIPPVKLPAFVLLDENAKRGGHVGPSPYGLIGEAIGAILMPSLLRRSAMGNMRVCMGFKGYKRYPTTKETYLVLNEGDDLRASILMLAKIASGPAPTSESLIS